jgi:hypothetical protein
VTCNENLHLVNTNVKGIGRDFFWPPNVPRDWSFEKLIDGHGHRGGCRAGADDPSGYPAESDPWSRWLDDYYGGLKLGAASNIVFSNGLLDPWSSGGVTKNISSSVVAVVLDLGAHHLVRQTCTAVCVLLQSGGVVYLLTPALTFWCGCNVVGSRAMLCYAMLCWRMRKRKDLMFPHPDDPPCAKIAREVEEEHIRQWITEAYAYPSNLH